MTQHHRTLHAKKRMQQRGINDIQVRLLETFGEYHYQKGGGHHVVMPAEILNELRYAIDRLCNVELIVGEHDNVITAMHKQKKTRHTSLAF